MAYVGYVYAHLIQAVRQASQGESVVKVLCVVRVDGAGEDVAEVLALGVVSLRDFSRQFLRGVLHVFRIGVWQPVLRQDGVHLRGVVACLSEYRRHFSYDMPVFVLRPFHHPHNHLVVHRRPVQQSLRHDDVFR